MKDDDNWKQQAKYWADECAIARREVKHLQETVEKEILRLFNLDWENQSDEATQRRKTINECRLSLAKLKNGDTQ